MLKDEVASLKAALLEQGEAHGKAMNIIATNKEELQSVIAELQGENNRLKTAGAALERENKQLKGNVPNNH